FHDVQAAAIEKERVLAEHPVEFRHRGVIVGQRLRLELMQRALDLRRTELHVASPSSAAKKQKDPRTRSRVAQAFHLRGGQRLVAVVKGTKVPLLHFKGKTYLRWLRCRFQSSGT